MRYLLIFLSTILFVGCTTNTENMPPAPIPGETLDTEKNDDDMLIPEENENEEIGTPLPLELGHGIVVDNFSERQLIRSPLELTGVAPRSWFFEGIIPITLLTLEEDVIAEGYGSGAWLEPIDGSDELGADDPIAFTSTITFETPDADMGKIRIAQDATGSEETGHEPAMVEILILWPSE